ncbi:helix-turn-helix domain-containing protein [Vallitalea okinawensis]|uniref:helix-turn-helix domain-containing protein n=1 Tax=Vallitalea okinawensis TaxID=2078660 RepID=UPI000CFD8830|nr:helix-turn-helix transcriptional regulator [Vallitalea okinawensis]
MKVTYKALEFFNQYFKLEIIEDGFVKLNNSWNMFKDSSPYNRLYFITGGKGYLKRDDSVIELTPHHCYLIPSNSMYDFICDENLDKFYIHFKASLVPGLEVFSDVYHCLSIPYSDTQIETLLKWVKDDRIENQIMCRAELLKVISQFITLYNIDKKLLDHTIKYKDIFQYIDKHLSIELHPNDICDRINISYDSLRRIIKSDTGKTLKQHIDSMIMQRAKEQLVITDKTIKTIAYELDFKDEFYFSRYFKKHEGKSPTQYKTKYSTFNRK